MEKLIQEFSLGLFFWQAVLFIGLLLLLRRFALASAEDAKKEMQNLQADNEKLIKEARAEREAMLKDAREIKAKMIEDAKGEAKAEADKMIAQAQSAIEAERKSAIADLKNQVASLSVEIAEKVVKSELSDKDKQLGLVEEMLGQATLN
jgi:F-type H+-transporting ATPase subunit b